MFTGLIQAIGILTPLDSTHLHLGWQDTPTAFWDLALGDSVAVDGVCLTVEHHDDRGFVATVSPETLRRSTLGQLSAGAKVNLEGSLRVGGKMGGHFVTGHVDGVGYFEAGMATGTAWELRFRVPDGAIARYIVPKGSIAINGVSLTVADCSPRGDWFTVAVIPLTYAETTLQFLQPQQAVNLEGDILGKYVQKFLSPAAASQIPQPDISLDFLAEHGYGIAR